MNLLEIFSKALDGVSPKAYSCSVLGVIKRGIKGEAMTLLPIKGVPRLDLGFCWKMVLYCIT